MKASSRPPCFRLISVLGVLLLLASCSDDKKNTAPESNDVPEVNNYLDTLPPWEQYAAVQDTVDAPAGNAIGKISGMTLSMETPYSITQNPEEIVTFGSAPNVLYLGSLIQGDSYLGGLGSMEELPIRQRAPLTIAVNLFSGTDVTATVDNPNAASVQAALNTIVSTAALSGLQSGNRVYYDKTETYSLNQAALRVGISFKYMGASAKAQLDYSASTEQHTVTAYFKQIMYEAYIVTPQTPAEFFNSEFTMEKLNEQIALGTIGPNNLPVYVGRMQYGRMMMFTMTSTAEVDSMKLAIQGSYDKVIEGSGELGLRLKNILQTSVYTIVVIGGSSSTALNLLTSGTLGDFFKSDDPINTGVPLAYTLYNLADGSIATVSETTSYTVTESQSEAALCYANESEWQDAVSALASNVALLELPTSAANLVKADELTAPPSSNDHMGGVLTFYPSETGYPFDFLLRAGQSGAHLVFDDLEGDDLHPAFPGMNQERSISIGDVDDHQNDNFEILIPQWSPNTAVLAIGLTIGDNVSTSDEVVEVDGTGDFSTSSEDSPNCPGTHGFIGVVSTVPLTRLGFNEGNDGDDIFVRDFRFGVLQWED